jgi:hypothetical protein
MDSLTRFRAAPVTTKEAKLNIFAPLDKLNPENYQMETVVFEDNKHRVAVSGIRLTQLHRDILDIALFHGDYRLENEIKENIPVRTFSLYKIQEHLRHKNRKNVSWLKEKFAELKRATILIEYKDDDEDIEFNIIRVAKRSHKLGEYVLVLEELYMAFFEKEIGIDYKELLPDILSLKHAQTKAVVRYMLSHQAGHKINIDKLLRKIGVQGEQRNLEYHRKQVLQELEEVGDKFNIELVKTTGDKRRKGDTTLVYTKHDKINIYHPTNQPTLF